MDIIFFIKNLYHLFICSFGRCFLLGHKERQPVKRRSAETFQGTSRNQQEKLATVQRGGGECGCVLPEKIDRTAEQKGYVLVPVHLRTWKEKAGANGTPSLSVIQKIANVLLGQEHLLIICDSTYFCWSFTSEHRTVCNSIHVLI